MLIGIAHACLNDRDSLVEEANRRPDILNAIVGRFDRNPPLYYQMRIDRVAKELKDNPSKLDLYDDIAVAYDRIGNDVKAIEWISRKKEAMDHLGWSHEDKYRYCANAGTFWVHRWYREDPAKRKLAWVKTAESLISDAVAIKPDAHFNREPVQLALIRMVLDKEKGALKPESDYFQGVQKVDVGLAGLVLLGNAWESPDVYSLLSGRSRMLLKQLAVCRYQELVAGGKKPFLAGQPESIGGVQWTEKADIAQQYRRLRAGADRYVSLRTAFMMERLKAGRHPDTDQHFWDGWNPPPAGRLISNSGFFEKLSHNWVLMIGLYLLILIGSIIGLVYVGKTLRRIYKA